MTDQQRFAKDGASELSEPRAAMPYSERNVWASAIATTVATAAYLIVVIPRVIAGPIDEVSWEMPMLWAIGGAIIGTIVFSILGAIGSEVSGQVGAVVWSAMTGRSVGFEAPLHQEDIRDREISQLGERTTMSIMASSLFMILMLAMLDTDSFWIGNTALFVGTIGTLAGAGVKIRAYRRGF
ncbi:hypothetical protein [Demequina oxidasica]|uniref:hypothetical protein n=1 Tax=Demequina oxidasica TaxID=676199 RepID=UPI000781022F|nr:hypothetical protein [Demequina oxidasica]